jgi:predicted dehydrogenase
MHKVRVGVIGTGYLGSIHARLYSQIDTCVLAGVCDIQKERADTVAAEFHVPAYTDHQELFDKVDAVSIAVPTKQHYAIAKDFLQRDIHALVEKPFTTTLKEADSLIALARRHSLILAVGHIERFNSAFAATRKIIHEPKFIESHRLSPFPNRSVDIGVVLDLMIHDIDIVLGLVNSRIQRIEAVGVPVLTPMEDIANARLTFKNGCVCNLTASRISEEYLRKIRIFQKDTYISLDYKDARACVYKKNGLAITKENLPIEKEQPLQKELASFIDCVLNRKEPLVSGTVARDALAIALEIQKKIWKRKSIS